MTITNNNLLDLPVYTRSGRHLGQVHSFEIDTDTQTIVRYQIRSANLIKNIIKHQELLIHRDQIIELTNEKMIVEDGLEPLVAPKLKKEKLPAEQPVGVMGSISK